ncbi:MAG: PIN domain-containing protein [Verrucomicrobia bacterium]|nr:PIN domain-containing protein [Verrucomicrobiota bacterium]
MICLDTNYLILGLVRGSAESARLLKWKQSGESLVTSATCWYEFLCGPISPLQMQTMRSLLDQILVFGEPQAAAAAQLFNAVGRKRTLRIDAMIAGTAQAAGAKLATNNQKDFLLFQLHGLQLA